MELTFANAVHCDRCNNTGLVPVVVDGRDMYARCACDAKRRSLIGLSKYGAADAISRFRFDNYEAAEGFQKGMLQLCRDFIAQDENPFLYISGQTGTGKTHLGNAVCGHFIAGGKNTLHNTFAQLMGEMKSVVNDDEAYRDVLNRYGNVPVLYIDDFMKFTSTEADVKHAFELINRRVLKRGITVFTSEKSLEQIIKIDEALGGRIKQLCGRFCLCIDKKDGRNWRLKA